MAGPSDEHGEVSFASQVEKFDFCGESIDTALRKLLAKVLLPKEAQQIDRAMETFAERYYECNPGLVDNPDVVYAVSFSILLLHTDAHNKNVRQKMNKDTFIMRTKIIEGGEGVAQEILDIMYDNIVMSEFTYADGHKESIGRTERSNSWFSKLKSSSSSSSDSNPNTQSSALLADLSQRLEQLMPAENTFNYKRTLKPIPIMEVHFSLLKAKSLSLAGVRSRYGNDTNNTFTIRVTKAGILDRKYDLIQGGKKATARGWRPFGVILSGSQIIFFADLSSYQHWLEHEHEEKNVLATKRNNSFPASFSSSLVESTSNLSMNANSTSSLYSANNNPNSITPIPTPHTLSNNTSSSSTSASSAYLRPVQIVSLSYAICICDEEYTKYPHVFRLITGDGQQFLLRADNENEMDDWMLKINYAATLKTTGVRMRPTKRPTTTSQDILGASKEQRYYTDRLKREEKGKEKVQELSDRIDEQVRLLDRELQLRRNLMVLSPFTKSTKDRIISFAETLGKRIKTKRIELQRLICYRDFLESELAWCSSQHASSRKLSLPLPTHLYSMTQSSKHIESTLDSPSPTTATHTTIRNKIEEDEDDDINEQTNNDNHHDNDDNHDGEEEDDDDDDIKTLSSRVSSSSINEDDNSSQGSSTPQLPGLTFPKSFTESLPFMDPVNIKTASDKAVEMDRMMRRRSQSNPVFPNRSTIVDKKLLLLEPPSKSGGRQRSGSEASSVKEDDDDMSMIIVNDSEELLNDPNTTWPPSPH